MSLLSSASTPELHRNGHTAEALPRYANVAVDSPFGNNRSIFTYSIPEDLSVKPGHLVSVPFGKRTVTGVVVQLQDEAKIPYTKPIIALVRQQPILSEAQLALASWVSDYYRCFLYEAMSPMLPPGFRGRSHASLRVKNGAKLDRELTANETKLLAYIRKTRGNAKAASMARTLGNWTLPVLKGLMTEGLVEEAWEWREPGIKPQYEEHLRLVDAPALALQLAEKLDARAPRQAALLRHLASSDVPVLVSAARRDFGAGAVSSLLEKGVAATVAQRVHRSPINQAATAAEPLLTPTAAQSAAIAAIRDALISPPASLMDGLILSTVGDSLYPGESRNPALSPLDGTQDQPKQPAIFLLHGITSSGKTEVYLEALRHCIRGGKRALVLVPELSLTPQMIARFNTRFPGRVGVLHSGLTPGQQSDEWWRVFSGAYDVVVGSRSAIFAPQRDLGLIVLDEEHEWTYKQEEPNPRYHARDVAIKLAELTGAAVVLGSATPDIVSMYHARQGRYRLLTLPDRIDPAAPGSVLSPHRGGELERGGRPITTEAWHRPSLPTVEIVDMRDELRTGNRDIFSRALLVALQHTVAEGNQAILFLNRRGSGGVVQCRSCGNVLRCWRCASPYTAHGPDMLLCHHCNHRRRVPATCPKCRMPAIRQLGFGTERVVEEVERLVSGARVLRWDRDTATTGKEHAELLDRFSRGDADVLVGTQMVAKGLHIPAVTLVGAVMADIGLHVPDFRAAERTFQSLCQVAGRAGRGSSPGRVIVQTFLPEHPAIQAAARQDYDAFYEMEMPFRRAQGYPPFGKLISLHFGHAKEETAAEQARELAANLRRTASQWGINRVEVIGPAPAYPPRLRGAWRWHILLRGPEPRLLLDKITLPPSWVADVDPVTVA